MAEFTFFCQKCGQHIQGDTRYGGSQINCPVCKQTIDVPKPGGIPDGKPPVQAKRKTPIIIAAAVLFIVIVGAGLFIFLKPHVGLVAWWPWEGNTHDIAGKYNGKARGRVAFAAGVKGQALQLDGARGYIAVPASPSLNIGAGSGITIEVWIKPSAANNPGGPIIEWDSSTIDGLQFWANGDGSLWANMDYDPANTYGLNTPGGVINTNSFQHVAVTYDKSSGMETIYADGTVVASKNVGEVTPQTTYPLNIGRRTGQPIGNGDTYSGLIDELRLYNRALSSSEILAIYNAGRVNKN